MTLGKKQPNMHTRDLAMLGGDNEHFLDKLCAVLLVLAPILQHYVGLYENAGFTALLVVFPILTLRFLFRMKAGLVDRNCLSAVLPLLIFEVYSAFAHGFVFNRMLYSIFMIWVFFCVACGCVNVVCVFRYAGWIACAASIVLPLQYLTYYLFGTHIRCVPTELFLEESSRWLLRSLHGVSEVGAMYRPSAFFLEPSHFFLYCFPILCLCLLLPNMTRWRKRMAVLITAGIVLSTSGMGIAVAIGIWGLYLTMYYEKRGDIRFRLSTLFSVRTICIMVVLIGTLLVAYFCVPIFQRSVNRIFTNSTGSTAIDGRVRLAINYIKKITGKAVLFGSAGAVSELEFNLAGFFATYIRWGAIGVILTYWFYGQGLLRLKGGYFWLTFIILVISFFTAHTHGTFYLMYYFLFLMDGYYKKSHVPSPRKMAFH